MQLKHVLLQSLSVFLVLIVFLYIFKMYFYFFQIIFYLLVSGGSRVVLEGVIAPPPNADVSGLAPPIAHPKTKMLHAQKG